MQFEEVIRSARSRAPMVHCLTNTVSVSLMADGLLAAGMRPMMTDTLAEAPVLVTIADALLINFGTLSTDQMLGFPATLEARPASVPWVLDPTAIGLAPVRTRMAREFLDANPDVVKGNASEIMALVGGEGGSGVDSVNTPDQAADAAVEVARRTNGVVVVTGATDIVATADGVAARIDRGDPMMARVTGTGCLLGALTAGCLAAADNALDAATAAVTWLDAAGELAAKRASGPGSFRVELLDALDGVARTGLKAAGSQTQAD